MLSALRLFKNRFGRIFAGLAMSLVIGLGSFSATASALSLPTSCNDAANEVIWCGASTVAQLQADYTNGDGHNSAASIQNIYASYGISANDINAMGNTAVAGFVTKTGDVVVNNQVVATGAITGGRDYIPGSTMVNSNGTTFYKRPPSVSFLSQSLDAFVVMTNGRFAFAVLSSCGNAVSATPTAPAPTPTPTPTPKPKPTSPNYTIAKQVSLAGTNQWASEVQVHPDTKVDYKVTVSSTGTADVTNLSVKDTLPNDVTYDQGTLTLNGNAMAQNDVTSFFNGGYVIGTLAAGSTDTFEFEAVAGANQNTANCTNETLPNVASMQASNLPSENSTATVSVVCVPPAPTTSTTPPAPAQPTKLVNTGPGSIMAIFTGVSVMGAVIYRRLIRNRLAQR